MSWKTEAILATSIPLHVCNRGVNGEAIFRDKVDYDYWMFLVADTLPRFEIDLHTYTLMSNHYHKCLTQYKSLEVSSFFQRVGTKYAKHFNKRHKRYGPVFAGRFRPFTVPDDAGLLRLSHYIHMNPVSAGICSGPRDWPYSSCSAYLSPNPATMINRDPILALVGGSEEYANFLASYDSSDPLSIHQFIKNGGRKI